MRDERIGQGKKLKLRTNGDGFHRTSLTKSMRKSCEDAWFDAICDAVVAGRGGGGGGGVVGTTRASVGGAGGGGGGGGGGGVCSSGTEAAAGSGAGVLGVR